MTCERIFHRAQDQRQRRSQLMTHIAEECGLGSVEFRQALGPLSLFLIRPRIGNAGGNLPGYQVKKSSVACVKLAVRIERGNENTRRLFLSSPCNWHQPRA